MKLDLKNIWGKFLNVFKSSNDELLSLEEMKKKRHQRLIIAFLGIIFLLPVFPATWEGAKAALQTIRNEEIAENSKIDPETLKTKKTVLNKESLWQIKQARINDDTKETIEKLNTSLNEQVTQLRDENKKNLGAAVEEIRSIVLDGQEKTNVQFENFQKDTNDTIAHALLTMDDKIAELRQYTDSQLRRQKLQGSLSALPPTIPPMVPSDKVNEPIEGLDALMSTSHSNEKLTTTENEIQEFDFASTVQLSNISTLDRLEDNSSDLGEFTIPMGASRGIMLTGATLKTLGSGASEPKPIFVKLVGDYVTSNNNHLNLDSCIVGGTAVGDFGSQLSEIRIQSIQCTAVDDNGQEFVAYTKNVKAWVYDESNLYGIESRVVTKEGKIFAKALPLALLNTAMDVAIVSANNNQQTTVTATGSVPLSVPAAQTFTAQTDDTMKRITDLWLKYLDSMTPVVQFKAGRKVTVAFGDLTKIKWEKKEFFNSNDPLMKSLSIHSKEDVRNVL